MCDGVVRACVTPCECTPPAVQPQRRQGLYVWVYYFLSEGDKTASIIEKKLACCAHHRRLNWNGERVLLSGVSVRQVALAHCCRHGRAPGVDHLHSAASEAQLCDLTIECGRCVAWFLVSITGRLLSCAAKSQLQPVAAGTAGQPPCSNRRLTGRLLWHRMASRVCHLVPCRPITVCAGHELGTAAPALQDAATGFTLAQATEIAAVRSQPVRPWQRDDAAACFRCLSSTS
jgi:hypothetical protein